MIKIETRDRLDFLSREEYDALNIDEKVLFEDDEDLIESLKGEMVDRIEEAERKYFTEKSIDFQAFIDELDNENYIGYIIKKIENNLL